MSELGTGTGTGTDTAEPAAAPAGDAAGNPGYDKPSPGGGYDGDYEALTAGDQLPARQDSRAATWSDNPGYDEAGLGGEYDGDLEALTAGDRLPARQDSQAATWGDDEPGHDNGSLGPEYEGEPGALPAEGQAPTRQESRAATWGDNPGYDETDPVAEYDGNLGALTAEDHSPATGEDDALDGDGDQDQAAAGEAPPAVRSTDDQPAEASGTNAPVAPEPEGDVTAPELSGASSDTGGLAEEGTGDQPHETPQGGQADALIGQAAQPDDGHADPDAAPEAGLKKLEAQYEASLKELKADYEASLKELEAEVQALEDSRQATPDAPGSTGRDADQPRAGDLPVDQDKVEAAERQDDRPGLWSNAKYALYGAAGTTVGAVLLDRFAPGLSKVVEDIVVGAPPFFGALVPTLREGWKRKHDNSPDKR